MPHNTVGYIHMYNLLPYYDRSQGFAESGLSLTQHFPV